MPAVFCDARVEQWPVGDHLVCGPFLERCDRFEPQAGRNFHITLQLICSIGFGLFGAFVFPRMLAGFARCSLGPPHCLQRLQPLGALNLPTSRMFRKKVRRKTR